MALFNNKSKKHEELSGVVNAAKTLLANIRFMSVDNPVRTIAITSAVPNEGKTFVAANLATAIATSGRTVLLVECDMRRRSMANALGVHAQHGLYSVVSGEVPLTTAAVATQTPNLYFLDSEPHIPNPSDLLNSHRFSRLVELASKTFDYVVFDTSPVGTFVDAAVLGTKVDAVFMVVREGFTKKAEVAAAAEQLRKSGCNLAGVVMNYCERRSSEYYYEYYYAKEGHDDADAPSMDSVTSAQREAAHASQDESKRSALPQRPQRRSRVAEAAEEALKAEEAEQEGVVETQAQPEPAPASNVAEAEVEAPHHVSTSDTDQYAALASNFAAGVQVPAHRRHRSGLDKIPRVDIDL